MTHHQKAAGPGTHDSFVGKTDQIPPLAIGAMLRALWQGKWLIVWSTILMVALAGYYAFRVTSPQYSATATLQLDGGTELLGDMRQPPGIDEAALNTNVALVTSDTVLTLVIDELDLLSDPELNRYLTAQSPLSLRNLRTQARHLLAGTAEQAPDQAAIQDKTIQNLRAKLTVSRRPETYILRITARSGDPEKAVLLANSTAARYLAHLQTREAQERASAEVWLQSRVTTLRSQLETQEMQIAALIATAQLQQDRGLDTLSAQVLAADQDLTEARNALATLETAPDLGSARNSAEMAQVRDKIGDIAAHKERLTVQLSAQSAGLAQLHQLQLQTDATRQLYQTFLGRLNENRIQQGLGNPRAQRIAPAMQGAYIGPQKTLILTIAALLGSIIGVMLVVIHHNTRKGIIDARDLRETTGRPVLAQFSTRALRQARGRRALPLPPGSKLTQTARELYTALTLIKRSPQVILSTSSIQAEGKTEHALLLAQTIARTGKRVLLVGADTQDKQLATHFAPETVQAATANWTNAEPAAHSAELTCDVLIIPQSDGDRGLIDPEELVERLSILRQHYDHIVIEGPPVLDGPLASLFASRADAILYAVRWSKTPRDVVERGLEILANIGCPATGLILSRVNLRKMRKLSNDPCISFLQTTHAV